MHPTRFECPICESEIRLRFKPTDQKIRCPYCRQSFYSKDALPLSRTPYTPPLTPQKKSKPQPNDSRPIDTSQPIASADHTTAQVENDPDSSVAIIRDQIHQRQRRQQWSTAISSLALLLLIIGLMVAIGYNLSSEPISGRMEAESASFDAPSFSEGNANDQVAKAKESKLDENGSNRQSDEDDSNGLADPSDPTTNQSGSPIVSSLPFQQPALTSTTPTAPNTPPQRPVYQFYRSKHVEDVWNTAKPYLVSLSIEGPAGKQQAVGTIIDSRGWVVTSLHLVRDAWRIEVSAPRNPLDRANEVAPLTDQVRGFVLQDETTDLAVLGVNPRFVLNFADLKLAKENRLVRNMPLLIAAPPSATNFFGISEAQIEQRGKPGDLPATVQARLTYLQLDQLDHVWLAIKSQTAILPGTPVFDGDGILQAIVRFNKHGLGYALPANQLKTRLANLSGRLSPLQRPLVSVAPGKDILLGVDHPVRQFVQIMNQKGTACRDFQWIAQTASEFQAFQDFAIAYVASVEYLNQLPLPSESEQHQAAREWIENAINELEQEIQKRWQQAVTAGEPQIEVMNQLAIETLKKRKTEDQFVPLMGTVFDQISNLDFWVIDINQGQAFTIADFDPRLPVMRPGTRWFLIGEQKKEATPQRIGYGDEKRLIAHPIRPLLLLGPIRN